MAAEPPTSSWRTVQTLRHTFRPARSYAKLHHGDVPHSSNPDSMDDATLDVDLQDEEEGDGGDTDLAGAASSTPVSAGIELVTVGVSNASGAAAGGRIQQRSDQLSTHSQGDRSPIHNSGSAPHDDCTRSSKTSPTTAPLRVEQRSDNAPSSGLSGSGSGEGVLVSVWLVRASIVMAVSVYVLLLAILSLLAGVWLRQNHLSDSLSSLSATSNPAADTTSSTSSPHPALNTSANATFPSFPSGSAIDGYRLLGAQFPLHWSSSLFAKLSASESQLVTVAVLGDSISAGSCCSNQYPTSAGTGYVNLLMQAYQSRYGDGGSGFLSPTSNRHFHNSAYSNDVLPVVVTGFNDVIGKQGSTDSTLYSSGTVDSTIDFYIRGTVATVVYFVGPRSVANYGSFAVLIDGQWVANIDTLSEWEARQVSTRFAVAAGEHRMVVRVVSGTVWLVGASGRNSGGVVVDNMSVPGLRVVDMAATTAHGNPFVNSDGGSPVTADLLILMLGLNDAGGKSLADYLAAMRAAITAYQAANVSDIVVVLPNGGNRAGGLFATYRAELPSMASALHVAYVDLNNIATPSYQQLSEAGFWARAPFAADLACTTPPGLPSTSLANANAVHPSDVGHWNMARTLWPLIGAAVDDSVDVPITWTAGLPV